MGHFNFERLHTLNFMKTILFLLWLFAVPGTSIFDLSFPGIDGKEVSMTSFIGKKILITSFNGEAPLKEEFRYMDSLQNNMLDLQIIVIPCINDRKYSGIVESKAMQKSIKSKIIFAAPSLVKKSDEKYQHPLFQWLTNPDNNKVLVIDGQPGQYFLISGKGNVYAVFDRGMPYSNLSTALSDNFDDSKLLK